MSTPYAYPQAELGLGIHGEPGAAREVLQPSRLVCFQCNFMCLSDTTLPSSGITLVLVIITDYTSIH